MRVLPGMHGSPGGGTGRRIAIGIRKQNAFRGNLVDAGGFHISQGGSILTRHGPVVTGQGIRPLVICDDPEDVGLLCL